MSHIFVSYSHKDSGYVTNLAQALEREGFDVWIDSRIDYGSQWPRVIQEYLDKCAVFIVVMTPRSYDSVWVQNELARAQKKEKAIFPMLLDGDEWLSVQSTQYIDVKGGKLPTPDFYDRLAAYAARSKPATPNPPSFDFGQWLPSAPEKQDNPLFTRVFGRRDSAFPSDKEKEILSAVQHVIQHYETWSISSAVLLSGRIVLNNQFLNVKATLTYWDDFSMLVDTRAATLASLGWVSSDTSKFMHSAEKLWRILSSPLLSSLLANTITPADSGFGPLATSEAITQDIVKAITSTNLFPNYSTMFIAKVEQKDT